MAKKKMPAKVLKVMTKGYAEILLPVEDWQCDMDCQV